MNYCRVSRKGSRVVFGQLPFPVDNRRPKTTPDPVRVACHQTKSDSYFFAGPKSEPPISKFSVANQKRNLCLDKSS
jgi:hypothetical protein